VRWARGILAGAWTRGAIVFVALLAVLLPLGSRLTAASGPPRVTLLPTTDGISWLIEDGAGRRIIVGGGETDSALRALSERTKPWERRVDLLVLPPPFRQHLPGATEIVRHTDITRIFEIGGPGEKPPARYDPWQLATIDRGHVPERIWGHLSVPLMGATLDLVAPEAPDGVPLKLPASPPKPPAPGSRPSPAIVPESAAATGGYLRLSNGGTSVLIALGTPDETFPGFARLVGPTLLIAPQTSTRTGLTAQVRPWATIAIADGTGPDTTGLPERALVIPQGRTFTVLLEGGHLRLRDIPETPAWAVKA
jgi:hypothetical protein